MLGSLRASVGSIWIKILLGFLIVTFGIWGVEDMVQRPDRSMAVATVGAAAVTAEDYVRAMQREAEGLRRALGGAVSDDMFKTPAFSRHVLQQMIDRQLVRQESEALGLAPSDGDIVRRIRANPAFANARGDFDKAIFEAALRNGNLPEKKYVEQLRQEIAANILVDTLLTVAPVPDAAARTLFQARQEGRRISLYTLKPALVSGIPAPGEEQVKAYYDAHGGQFTAPEYRKISYVTLGAEEAGKNVTISEEEIAAAYRERESEFKRPERRTVEQLLYDSEESARKASHMLKAGKDFARVAKETAILNKNAIAIGKVGRGGVIEQAADAVFALPQGGITDPVKSPFGWHIFRVTAIEPPATASLEEMRPMLEKDLRQQRADGDLNALVGRFQDALAGGGSFAETAKEHGLTLRSAGSVDRRGKTPEGEPAGGLPAIDAFLETAFKTEENADSPMNVGGGGYYMLHVDSVIPERLRPLEEVRDAAAAGWRQEEQAKRLAVLAGEIAAAFDSAAGRKTLVEKYRLPPPAKAVIRRASRVAGDVAVPPELVAEAFAGKLQGSTGAHAGQNGDYLLAVVEEIEPAPAPEATPELAAILSDIRRNLHADLQNEILQQYTRHLARAYPVAVDESALQAVLK